MLSHQVPIKTTFINIKLHPRGDNNEFNFFERESESEQKEKKNFFTVDRCVIIVTYKYILIRIKCNPFLLLFFCFFLPHSLTRVDIVLNCIAGAINECEWQKKTKRRVKIVFFPKANGKWNSVFSAKCFKFFVIIRSWISVDLSSGVSVL